MSLFSFYVIMHISFVTTLMNTLVYQHLLKFISRIDCCCKITKNFTKWILFHQKSMRKTIVFLSIQQKVDEKLA